MISVDEITAMQPNKDVWEEVRARAISGVTPDRLMNQNQIAPITRYLDFCEKRMFDYFDQLADAQRRTEIDMGVIPKQKRGDSS